MLLDNKVWVGTSSEGAVCMLPQMANRHGLISGATGTGKTVTLQVMAEAFSQLGVPVFLADVRERMGRIESAIRAGDWTVVSAEAHTIKGSSGTLCAGNLQQAARELERAGGCSGEAPARFESLRRCFERLEHQLLALASLR